MRTGFLNLYTVYSPNGVNIVYGRAEAHVNTSRPLLTIRPGR
jgi:hypothetical protein